MPSYVTTTLIRMYPLFFQEAHIKILEVSGCSNCSKYSLWVHFVPGEIEAT